MCSELREIRVQGGSEPHSQIAPEHELRDVLHTMEECI